MNNLLNKIRINLTAVLLSYDLNDDVQFIISKFPEVDLQINNLVKYKEENFFDQLLNKFQTILEETNIFSEIKSSEIGFLNLSFNHSYLSNIIKNSKDELETNVKRTLLFDYGGPNIGKPLHVGHIRTLNIGRSLYNSNSFIGNTVKSDSHLGDWGMPVAQIITYLEKNKISPESVTAGDLEIIYPKASKEYWDNVDFKKRAQEINKLLNNGDKNLYEIWKIIKNISLENLKIELKKLNQNFDYWYGESDVNNLIAPMINDLVNNKKVIKDEGALISSENVDPKILITKSDGSYLYITTDLATVLYRKKYLPYDKAYYIVDSRQSLHFKQLFSSINYFEFSNAEHEHIAYGTINDAKGNPFKTRDGGTKSLNELFQETKNYIKNINNNIDETILDQLTNSVLTFSDLLTNRKTDYKFDLEKFTNINGKTGIYVQYAQVRAKKLLLEIGENKKDLDSLVLSSIDKDLLSKLYLFGYHLEQCVQLSEPHHLANYLYEISSLFNAFYEDEKLNNITNQEHLASKILILKLFLTTSQNVMFCLGMEPVERM